MTPRATILLVATNIVVHGFVGNGFTCDDVGECHDPICDVNVRISNTPVRMNADVTRDMKVAELSALKSMNVSLVTTIVARMLNGPTLTAFLYVFAGSVIMMTV